MVTRDGSLVAGLAHAAAGQQQRGAEEAASCVRQRGRNATGRYIRLVTVNLTRIYTRLGDGGETHLGDMSRVPKTHPRIEAYGAIDELNALVGLALTAEGLPERYAEWLRRVQNDLFDLGADLSVPEGGERERLRVAPEQVTWLEQACDEVNATLEPLKSFVLPGGSVAAAHLHVCRTVCRRAERRALVVRGRQSRGRALPQPPLRPALHPQPRGQRGRRAAVGAGAVSHVGTGHPSRPPIAMRPLDEGAMAAARARQAQLVKPPGSLGRLEDLAVWLAGVTGSERPALHARVVVAAADHGVAAQGVSAYPQAVTGPDAAHLRLGPRRRVDARGRGRAPTSSWSTPAWPAAARASTCVRVGLAPEPRPVRAGRRWSVAEVALAVDAGRDLAARAAADGITVLAGGEMGIANTTPATCLAAVLTGRAVADLVGPGTGLDDAGVAHKRAVCERALALHADAARGPLHALRRVGGGEIAVLCGLALGAGEHGLGYVCDGLIATAAAAVAVGIEPDLRPRLLAGHRSPEPAHGAPAAPPRRSSPCSTSACAWARAAARRPRAGRPAPRRCAAHEGMATFAEAGVSGSSR